MKCGPGGGSSQIHKRPPEVRQYDAAFKRLVTTLIRDNPTMTNREARRKAKRKLRRRR